jgi:porin
MTVSGIEAPATTRLFNLWFEQAVSDKTSLRIGQISAAQEFFVSQNANLFVNSTFGWPVLRRKTFRAAVLPTPRRRPACG